MDWRTETKFTNLVTLKVFEIAADSWFDGKRYDDKSRRLVEKTVVANLEAFVTADLGYYDCGFGTRMTKDSEWPQCIPKGKWISVNFPNNSYKMRPEDFEEAFGVIKAPCYLEEEEEQ